VQLQIAGAAANGLIIGSMWRMDDPEPINQKFVSDYIKQFNRDPGNFSAMAYNGAYFAKMAIEASGETSREALQTGLLSVDGFKFLGCPIKMKNRDAFTDKPIMLMVKDGKFIPFTPAAFK
jgi:branched-chain amino acid transport system substrate-binding protein